MSKRLITVIAVIIVVVAGIFIFSNQEPSSTDQSPATETEEPKTGTIEGSMGFPSQGIPKDIIVCAENTETKDEICTDQRGEGGTGIGYAIADVPVGTYLVYERFIEGTGNGFEGDRAYYSEYVVCGISVECEDHTPIEVSVTAGETTTGIDPVDWYTPPPEE